MNFAEQEWESKWWGDCWNKQTFGEIVKQNGYMPLLGLTLNTNGDLDLEGKSVLDIGGGPVSILLRAINPGRMVVADPCEFPPSVARRYKNYGIEYLRARGETLRSHFDQKFDEVWMYNVLQHTTTPGDILQAAKALGKTIRIFDWLNVGICPGHPSNLTKELFLRELSDCQGVPNIGRLKDPHLTGEYFAGIFQSDVPPTNPKTVGGLMLERGWQILSRGVDLAAPSGTFIASLPVGNRLVVVENGEIKNLEELC